MNVRIAKLLSDFGFFMFGRFYGSLGYPSPLYIASKKLYSQPDKMKIISEEIAKFMKGKKIDLVAGTAVSGTPLAMAVSLASQKPFVYIRYKKEKGCQTRPVLEGLYRKRERVLVVDDGIGSGRTKEQFIKKLERKGLIVKDVLVLYDAEVEKLPFYKERGIKIHSFVKHNDLVNYMEQHGYISKELASQMHDFWKNLKEWQQNEQKWKEFVTLAKSEGFDYQ